jgi:hypothetical protein
MSQTRRIEPASPDAWRDGTNPSGDEALRRARHALYAADLHLCLAALGEAMRAYGWDWHSDAKARRLWGIWRALAACYGMGPDAKRDCSDTARSLALYQAIDDNRCDVRTLFHEVFSAVHLDRDKRLRRNLPPWNPESLHTRARHV